MPFSSVQAPFRRPRIWVLILFAVIAIILADHLGLFLVPRTQDFTRYHLATVPVVEIIDGDTFDIALPDPLTGRPATRIRVWGIDCPEEARAGSPAQPWAAHATSLTRNALQGKSVRLTLEPQRVRDSFCRILAHVETPDESDLATLLLRSGLSSADDRWPHAHLLSFSQLERTARHRQLGIWSPLPPPPLPQPSSTCP